MKTTSALFFLLVCIFAAVGHAQDKDKRMMTDADYKTYLTQVEAALPKWETALKNIKPERVQRTSYATGKSLLDIGQIRAAIAEQRVKRTLSGELVLLGIMQSLQDMGHVLSWEQTMSGGDTTLRYFGSELKALLDHIDDDVKARVALLDKSTVFPVGAQPTGSLYGAIREERLKRIEDKDYPIPVDNDYRGVDGVWVPESNDPAKALVFPEQVKITCIHSENICRELKVILGELGGMVSIIDIDETDWPITSWDAHGLLASYGPDVSATGASDRCHSHVLTMAFGSGAVSTSDIPTHEKGCEEFFGTDSYRLARGTYYVDTTPGNDMDRPHPKK
ncbi:MAG: hypothetical protein ABSC77_01620 [Terracidiphilus sp.]